MSEFAKDDNITNSGTYIRDDEDEIDSDSEPRIIEVRCVPEFLNQKNAGLEHYLYFLLKDPSNIKFDRNRRRYYVPAAKNLRDDMKAEELRFVALRMQKCNEKRCFRKWQNNGGVIVHRWKVPDPVNLLNLMHREMDTLELNNRAGKSRKGRSRNLFHKMMGNRNKVNLVKYSNSIDFDRDVYFDPRYSFRQKKITNYFKPAAALAELK